MRTLRAINSLRTRDFTKISVFWVVAPCSLVEVYQRFKGSCCLHHQGDEGAASTSETLVNFFQTTRRYNPEDSHLRTHRRENLKSYKRLHINWRENKFCFNPYVLNFIICSLLYYDALSTAGIIWHRMRYERTTDNEELRGMSKKVDVMFFKISNYTGFRLQELRKLTKFFRYGRRASGGNSVQKKSANC
jgi:hypothetical protein